MVVLEHTVCRMMNCQIFYTESRTTDTILQFYAFNVREKVHEYTMNESHLGSHFQMSICYRIWSISTLIERDLGNTVLFWADQRFLENNKGLQKKKKYS